MNKIEMFLVWMFVMVVPHIAAMQHATKKTYVRNHWQNKKRKGAHLWDKKSRCPSPHTSSGLLQSH